MTKEEGINQVMDGGRHIVILGAGASIASTFRNPEKNRKVLPSMYNLINVLELTDIVSNIDDELKSENFEQLYANLYKNNCESETIKKIESRIFEYFKDMKLPNEPTIYDYLVLSLRQKDLIATFNWDPFLYQAWVRNRTFTEDLPHLSFLHSNVAIGYDNETKRCGPAGWNIKDSKKYLEPTRLLYPIEKKNYSQDEFLDLEWERLKFWLKKENGSVRATIFGYSAPTSDVEAIEIMKNAWGSPDNRSMEQFEIIDIEKEDELKKRWRNFIHSNHFDFTDSYFGSSLAKNPRRTCEAYFCATQPLTPSEAFRQSNPIPQNFKSLEELRNWHIPLISAEQNEIRKNAGAS